jgi:recombination protein RecA
MPQLLTNEEALADLGAIEGVLEKHLGIGIFATEEVLPIPRAPTGIAVVDHILGGGLPKGMITEAFGPESVGKTTFFTQMSAYNQKLDPNWRVLYLDFEQTFDMDYSVNGLGLNNKRPNFILSQPKTIEEGAMIARILMSRGLISQVIWDTPASSQPSAIINRKLTEKEIREGYRDIESGKSDTGSIGLHARVFSHALASLVPLIAEHQIVFCVPTQIRTTINTWGAGETTSGGRALKFHAAVRIRLSKKDTIKESVSDGYFGTHQATAVENLVQFHSVKNKTAPPFRLAVCRLRYGVGFLDRETLLDLAVKRGIVKKAGGGNFELPGEKKIRGTQEVIKYWVDNPAEYDKVQAALRDTKPAEDEHEVLIEELPEGKVKI